MLGKAVVPARRPRLRPLIISEHRRQGTEKRYPFVGRRGRLAEFRGQFVQHFAVRRQRDRRAVDRRRLCQTGPQYSRRLVRAL